MRKARKEKRKMKNITQRKSGGYTELHREKIKKSHPSEQLFYIFLSVSVLPLSL
jgi:hypothetical protein